MRVRLGSGPFGDSGGRIRHPLAVLSPCLGRAPGNRRNGEPRPGLLFDSAAAAYLRSGKLRAGEA